MAHCTVPECSREVGPKGAKGMCPLHYRRLRRTGHVEIQPKTWMNQSPCAVEGCGEKARKIGVCANHYSRIYKYGRTDLVTIPWRKSAEPCLWCGGQIPQSRGRSNYCGSSCQLLRSQNLRAGVNARVAPKCVKCSAEISAHRDGEGGRLPRVDTLLCDPCRRSRSTRHRMPIHLIIERDRGICGICGGSHDPSNLQLAHRSCNSRKGARAA